MEGTSAKLALREATVADANAIAEIHVGTWRVAYRGLIPDDYLASLSVEQRREYWKGALSQSGPGKVAVAEDEAGIIGFCAYGPTRDADGEGIAEIYAVYVQPGKWNRGAGRALCELAFREAAAREHTAITLWALKGNEVAHRF